MKFKSSKEEVMKFKSSILPPLGPELIKKMIHWHMRGWKVMLWVKRTLGACVACPQKRLDLSVTNKEK